MFEKSYYIFTSLVCLTLHMACFAQQHNPSLSEGIKQFFNITMKTAVMNVFNKQLIELRIKANNNIIEPYSFSQALLDNQPLLSGYMLPVDYYTQREEYDVDISHVCHNQIAKVLKLAHKIAAAKSLYQRNNIYKKLENKVRNYKISLIQALQCQAILNTLQLRLNSDAKGSDIILKVLLEEEYLQKIIGLSLDRASLTTIAQQDLTLRPIISKFLEL